MKKIVLLLLAIAVILTVVGCAPGHVKKPERRLLPTEKEAVSPEEKKIEAMQREEKQKEEILRERGETTSKEKEILPVKQKEEIKSAVIPTPPPQGVIKDCLEHGLTHGQCSPQKPFYCENGALIPKCSVCGCPDPQFPRCVGESTCLPMIEQAPAQPAPPPPAAPQAQFTCTPVVINGPAQNKIDLVFLSDGFTSSTMNLFDTAVDLELDWDGTSNGLFSKTPFKENKNKFNIYKISSDMLSNCGQCTSPQAVSCGANEYFFDVSKQACGIEPDFIIKVHNRLCPDGNQRMMASGGGGTYRTIPISIMLFSEDLSDQNTKELLQGATNHETGHALGQFTEEYASGNRYHEFWNYPNVDNVGCPKWCSGQIDTNQPCYQTYLTWLQCVQPFLTFLNQPCGRIGDQYSCVNEQIMACSNEAGNTELAAGRDLLACNIGTNCIAGTGCFWGGGMSLRNWRATYQGIMREAIAESYGARDEKILQDRINQLTQG